MCLFSSSHVIDRLRSKSRSHPQEGGLRDVRSTSPESIALPKTSVPHRNANIGDCVLEDAKALRDIFGTPSSIRGYEAARGIPKPDEPARYISTTPNSGGLGALGHAVRQRLSENRLSKETSRTGPEKKPPEEPPEKRDAVGISYRSTGLSHILMSRTASEGGYDSDAKDISTVRLDISSEPGSLSVNPEYLTEKLRPQKDDSPEKSSSGQAMLEHKSDLLEVPADHQVFPEKASFPELAGAYPDVREVTAPKTPCTTAIQDFDEAGEQKLVPSSSEALSDEQSLHLGDMRISQRLASTSKMAMTSLSSTNFGSNTGLDAGADVLPEMVPIARSETQRHSLEDDLPWHLQRQPGTAARYPKFVAHEHNRRPSDPKTRMLFEDATDGNKSPPKWRSVTGATNVPASLKDGEVIKEGRGSYDMNEDELPRSRAASITRVVHSETLKNPNSLAIPGRRASGARDQSCGSFGQVRGADGDTIFGKREKPKPLAALEDGLGPHEQGSEQTSAYCESGNVSKYEAMSEIGVSAVLGKRFERVSAAGTNTPASRSQRRCNSTETRSTTGSQGWLTSGRRCGFGYDFIEGTSSGHSRSSREEDAEKGSRDEKAEDVWGRAFKKVREEESVKSTSKSMLNVPSWGHRAGRNVSTPSACDQRGPDLRRPSSAVSERMANPGEPINGYFDLGERHQRIDVEAPNSPSRQPPQLTVKTGQKDSLETTSPKGNPAKRSLLDIRRYIIGSAQNGSTASSALTDFPSWCKFPSHNRQERNGAAGDKDGVETRDFSPPTTDMKRSQFQSDLTVHKSRSASSPMVPYPGSWRRHAFGHMRRKSKSMTFASASDPRKHRRLAHRGFFWQLRNFYHSQFSDIRRLQAGHRSSVTLSRESKYPELDIPAGFGPLMLFDVPPEPFSRMTLDQVGLGESTGEDTADSTGPKDGELWSTVTETTTGYETGNCLPVRETKSPSPQKAMLSPRATGLDGMVSSGNSEEQTGDVTKSGTDLSSALRYRGNGTQGSFVSITASNGFADESGDFGVPTREFRLASTELRDSTVDFRTALMEREQKSRNELLRLAQGMDGAGEGDGGGELEEEKDEGNQNKV